MSVRQRLGFLGGRLDVPFSPGQGTQMALVAPRLTAAAPAPVLLASAGQPDTSLPAPDLEPTGDSPEAIRVLLADDHKILREGLVSLLQEEEDIEVVGEASDGAMAVEMALRLRPDVVVMDITMPKMSGIEATRRITHELPDTAVIGLSMHSKADMAAALRDAGAAAYLTKGGPSEALLDAIRNAAS